VTKNKIAFRRRNIAWEESKKSGSVRIAAIWPMVNLKEIYALSVDCHTGSAGSADFSLQPQTPLIAALSVERELLLKMSHAISQSVGDPVI